MFQADASRGDHSFAARRLIETGNYSLGLGCRPPSGPSATHLQCSDIASDTIGFAAEVDYYTFDGTAGDIVELALVDTGGFSGP
ncbi:hypothetical protein IH979_01675, partial [Patescibacteria group bacterium]|nr:hypothetical protein [Patescibacteria group bacterium]